VKNGRSLAPFVLLREATGRVAEKGRELIEFVRQLAQPNRQHAERAAPMAEARDTQEEYGRLIAQITAQAMAKNEKIDRSRLDFRAAQALSKAGHSQESIVDALKTSPHVAGRQQSGIDDYAKRTAKNARQSARGQERGGPEISM
jgi:hypothetical protein